MPTVNTPLYRDWGFWAALLALIAIVLSQLPPLRTMLLPGAVYVGVYNRVLVDHFVGNPTLGVPLNLRNDGSQEETIEAIDIAVYKNGKFAMTLPASDFFEELNSPTPIVFVPFTLKAGEHWFHSVQFYQPFDRLTYKKSREEIEALTFNINIKKQAQRLAGDKTSTVSADEQFVAPFYARQAALFFWTPAGYAFNITVKTRSKVYHTQSAYQFTIYDSESQSLINYREHYRYGGILNYRPEGGTGIFIPVYPLGKDDLTIKHD